MISLILLYFILSSLSLILAYSMKTVFQSNFQIFVLMLQNFQLSSQTPVMLFESNNEILISFF